MMRLLDKFAPVNGAPVGVDAVVKNITEIEAPDSVVNPVEGPWSKEQLLIIDAAVKSADKGCLHYFNTGMSPKKISIVADCYVLGKEYAEQILSAELDDEQCDTIRYAYSKDFNVFEEVVAGESLENLKLLIDAVNLPGFNLMEYFGENGEYIDYEKLKKLLKQ